MSSEGMNTVILLGNLGADPELRQTQVGPVLKLRLATTEVYFDKDNQKKEKTEWHHVTVFGRRGEGLSKILTKGSRICVNGRLHTSSYEKEGSKRYRTEVVADDVFLAGGKGPNGSLSSPMSANGAMHRASREAPRTGEIPF
jgi:single-strand DNA-binding protein